MRYRVEQYVTPDKNLTKNSFWTDWDGYFKCLHNAIQFAETLRSNGDIRIFDTKDNKVVWSPDRSKTVLMFCKETVYGVNPEPALKIKLVPRKHDDDGDDNVTK